MCKIEWGGVGLSEGDDVGWGDVEMCGLVVVGNVVLREWSL